jgi:hypothetical protein
VNRSRVFVILALTIFLFQKTGFAQNTPTPSTSNNYYYSGNWYYDQQGPVPGKSLQPHSEGNNNGPNKTKANTLPSVSENDKNNGNPLAHYEKHAIEVALTVVPTDWPIIIVNGLLLILVGLQLNLLYWTFIADHRPRLRIGQFSLMNVEANAVATDTEGNIVPTPVLVGAVISNRGGSRLWITQGSITLRADKKEGIGLKSWIQQAASTPITFNMLPYSEDQTVAVNRRLKAAERCAIFRTIPVSESNLDAGEIYFRMSIRETLKPTSVALHVFGYFTYRDWTRRRYMMAFYRSYDPEQGIFVPSQNPDYEYAD